MRSLDSSQPADALTRRNLLALAAMGIMPALRSASTTGQKQNLQNPAENTPPARIFARVQDFGPENNQGIIAITPADGSWQWVEQMPGLARLSPDGHTLAFLGTIEPHATRDLDTRYPGWRSTEANLRTDWDSRLVARWQVDSHQFPRLGGRREAQSVRDLANECRRFRLCEASGSRDRCRR